MEISTIRAFQKVLTTVRFDEPLSFPEEFAQKRFLKKMETPDLSRSKERAQLCWEQFIEFDRKLPLNLRPTGTWYKVRKHLHDVLEDYSVGLFRMTDGSEFYPTSGKNSVEAKLAGSIWSVTRNCRDQAIAMIRDNASLTRAFKQRYRRAIKKKALDIKQVNRYIWKTVCRQTTNKSTRIDLAWVMKADLVFKYVNGSRFSTVRKNNEKDRPINIEPLLNVLVQREIGVGIRDSIKKHLGIDLLTLATGHKERVSKRIATIDLQNASDSILWSLCEFLFPRRFLRLLKDSRSEFVLGGDGVFHPLRKVSAMGNGFTFELMSLILNSLVHCYDLNGSVFGDDIIIDNTHAVALIGDLESVGFVVNTDKSYIDSDFRESCGAHFHESHGYLKSFDFEYPEHIGDCVTLYNKCKALSMFPSFSKLEQMLRRSIPPALRGVNSLRWTSINAVPSIELPTYFACEGECGRGLNARVSRVFESFHHDPKKFRIFYGWEFKNTLRSPTRTRLSMRNNWAKYLMYLYSGSITDDVVKGSGSWQRISFVGDGNNQFRLNSINKAILGS